jgi:hypothetical protein
MRIELELDDKGELVGQVPTEIDAILKRIEATAHGQGYGKGAAKAAEDAKKQIEETVRAKVAEMEARMPLEREKWQGIEEENKSLKTQLTDRLRESDRTLRAREEAHAEELTKRVDAIGKRNARIQALVRTQIQGLALQAGAREESLPELEVILGASIGYDDDMEPFVKGPDGSALQVHGKPVGLQAYVKQYIDNHPHHRRPATGTGGGARGGASFHGHSGTAATAEAARARVEAGDRSPTAINDVFEATRQKRSA